MKRATAKTLKVVLHSVSEAIQTLRSCNVDGTAALLEMVELDLRMKIHGISEGELSLFCKALENRLMKSNERGKIIELQPHFTQMDMRKVMRSF